jgi:hypothetical protein
MKTREIQNTEVLVRRANPDLFLSMWSPSIKRFGPFRTYRPQRIYLHVKDKDSLFESGSSKKSRLIGLRDGWG